MKIWVRLRQFHQRLWPSARSRWVYTMTMPWAVPFMGYTMIGKNYVQDLTTFLGGTLVIGFLCTVSFLAHNWAADYITVCYPGLRQTGKRLLLMMLAFTALAATSLITCVLLFAYTRLFNSALAQGELLSQSGVIPTVDKLGQTLTGLPVSPVFIYSLDIFMIFLFASVYEIFYSLSNWKQSKLNKEVLRKANLQGQLQGLRSQISPHFLFNSLNSLSSLIIDEPKRAEQFVDEMANVYRYLLQTSEQELTSLSVEIDFIQSYYHLLKTRYGAGFELRIAVDEPALTQQLPPLTLQMLVENAVKHNVILASRPLCVDITTTPMGELQISNNLQPKVSRNNSLGTTQQESESTCVGLANIAARYQLLAQADLKVSNGPDFFIITLPLLSAIPKL